MFDFHISVFQTLNLHGQLHASDSCRSVQKRMKLMPCAQLINDALRQNIVALGSITFFTAQKAAGFTVCCMSY